MSLLKWFANDCRSSKTFYRFLDVWTEVRLVCVKVLVTSASKTQSIGKILFKYSDNNSHFKIVSPGRRSWCCTWLFTWKMTEIVWNRSLKDLEIEKRAREKRELERKVQTPASFSPLRSWQITAWSGCERQIVLFLECYRNGWTQPNRSDVGKGVRRRGVPELFDHLTCSSDTYIVSKVNMTSERPKTMTTVKCFILEYNIQSSSTWTYFMCIALLDQKMKSIRCPTSSNGLKTKTKQKQL